MSEIIKDEFQNDVDRILNMTDKHAANFYEAQDGIYVEKGAAIIGADLSELPDYAGTPDNSYVNPESGESEEENE